MDIKIELLNAYKILNSEDFYIWVINMIPFVGLVSDWYNGIMQVYSASFTVSLFIFVFGWIAYYINYKLDFRKMKYSFKAYLSIAFILVSVVSLMFSYVIGGAVANPINVEKSFGINENMKNLIITFALGISLIALVLSLVIVLSIKLYYPTHKLSDDLKSK